MRKKRGNIKIYNIFIRYIILLLIALPNLWIFYFIFTPLTIYPVFFLLKLFFPVSLSGSTLILKGTPIQLVKSCIAGSAYYLLLILNLTTPMQLRKRVFSVLFSFLVFLIINIFRIFFFSILFLHFFSLFKLAHLITWYLLSAVIIFLVWLTEIKLFKIKKIPVYSDIKFLYGKIKRK